MKKNLLLALLAIMVVGCGAPAIPKDKQREIDMSKAVERAKTFSYKALNCHELEVAKDTYTAHCDEPLD